MNPDKAYIAVDFDGTLAKTVTHVWNGPLGEPIPEMLKRVQDVLNRGTQVKIFTARVALRDEDGNLQPMDGVAEIRERIEDWTEKYLGKRLDITCCKCHNVIEIWDDRARQVIRDTGQIVEANIYE
jgi:hypothetical protein